MDKKYYLELDIIQQIKSLYADEVKFLLWFILNIIICLWSLEKNTFKYISLRQRIEFRDSLNNSEENSNDLNTSISLSSVNRNEENDEEA